MGVTLYLSLPPGSGRLGRYFLRPQNVGEFSAGQIVYMAYHRAERFKP
jgi:hypothetical protein